MSSADAAANSKNEWMVDFVAGWVSGAVATIACQPVDTVLTRWQAFGHRSMPAVGALWNGAFPMIGAVPLQNALLMGGYGIGERFYSGEEDESDLSYFKRLGAIFVGGCTGGVLQSFLMSPVELIKVTQQIHPTATVIQAVQTTNAWRLGLNATLLRDGVPHGVWFLSYDVCKNAMSGTAEQQNGAAGSNTTQPASTPVVVPMVSGAVAATVAWAVGYPADLIKTRIQAGGPLSVVENVKTIVKENGVIGLYRGFGMKLVRAVPASMIGFTVYESVKDQILPLL